jgi:hypothetical protein
LREADEDMLPTGLNPGRLHAPSRLDEVGAVVRLGLGSVDLADEDVNSAEGDPVPVLD